MKIILYHPTGNTNVRAVAESLREENILAGFYTTIASYPSNLWYRLSKVRGFNELDRRGYDANLKSFIKCFPWYELGRSICSKAGLKKMVRHEKGIFCVDNVYKSLSKYAAAQLEMETKTGATAVYAYEDGALEIFEKAKALGLTCIYDLPIAYWETGRRLMQEEAIRLPSWASTLGGGIQDSKEKLDRKKRELELADVVVGPGSFVMNSLPDWANKKKLIISAFGSPKVVHQTESYQEKPISRNPMRVLFVGSMGQRKGLGDLFSAMKLLNNKHIELIVLGSLFAPMDFYRKEFPYFIYERNRSHSEVLKLMRTCDIFCLPSIVEGRALVMQEAMSQGLPLIITANTGGEDLISEEETRFLVPIRSPEKIAEKIQWFYKNRHKIPEMGEKCKILAQTYTWKNYGKKIVENLRDYSSNTKRGL